MKRIAHCLALPLALAAPAAQAGIGTADARPAATLLMPYFEISAAPNFPAPQATPYASAFSVSNTLAEPILARVTLWSDLGVPTLAFDLHLTGYDTETVDLRLLFDGILPQSGTAISNVGEFSDAHDSFPGCAETLDTARVGAGTVTGRIEGATLDALRRAHSGLSSTLFGGQCVGVDRGDGSHRGYVTVDAVNGCSGAFPDEAGYFAAGGTGVASNTNALWGVSHTIDSANNFASSTNLVHVEASATHPDTSAGPGKYTFYGRHTGFTAADNREALGTVWGAPFSNMGPFSEGTSLMVWRDPKTQVGPYNCIFPPNPYPLSRTQVVFFDEEENPSELSFSDEPFAYATQRTMVGGPDLPVPYDSGWLFLNLNYSFFGQPLDPLRQSYVWSEDATPGRFATSLDGVMLSHPYAGGNPTIAVPTR